MATKFISTWFSAAMGTTQRKKFIGSETVVNPMQVDLDGYTNLLQKTYEQFDAAGYDVINVVPIAMGQSEPFLNRGGAYLGDSTFSITRGAVVIGQRRE